MCGSASDYNFFLKPSAVSKKEGISLHQALVSFVLANGLATNPSGDCCTLIPVTNPGSYAGVVNLSYNPSPTDGTVSTDTTGSDAIIPLVNDTNAGLMPPGLFTDLSNITITGPVDLDGIATDISALIALTGMPVGSTNLSTFSGNTIPNNVSIKAALQSLETALELRQVGIQWRDEGANLGSAGTADVVNFIGSGVTATRSGNTINVTIGSSSEITVSDGDKGDITVSGSGSVWTIDPGVVTPEKTAPIPTDSLMGRDTAGSGSYEVITLDLDMEFTGTQKIRNKAFTGDVIKSAGNVNTTIAPLAVNTGKIDENAVTNTKLADMGAFTIKGNDTSSNGDPKDLQVFEVKTLFDYHAAEINFTPAGELSSTNVSNALFELDNEKQPDIQFKDEGVALGAPGGVKTVDIVGAGATASITGDVLTINVPGAGGTAQQPLQFQDEGIDLGTVGTVNTLDVVGLNIEATRSGGVVTIEDKGISAQISGVDVGQQPILNFLAGANTNVYVNEVGDTIEFAYNVSSYRQVYSVVDAVIVGTKTGITFTRDSASIWTINIPASAELISIDIYSAAAQNPGSNVTININHPSIAYNLGVNSLRIPMITGVNLGGGAGTTPATYAPTTGSTNLFPQVQSVSAGNLQLLINNFNNSSGLGVGATILKLMW